MQVISQAGVMTRYASADIATYYFDEPGGGVVERPLWTLALWLAADISEAKLGFDLHALPPWPEVGAISLVPPGTPLHWRSGGGYVRSITCRYTLDVFRTLTGIDPGTLGGEDNTLLALRGAQVAPIRASMTQIATEMTSPRRGATMLVESLCAQTAIYLSRAVLKGSASLSGSVSNTLGPVNDPLFPTHIIAVGGLTPHKLRIVTDNAERLATGEWHISDAAKFCGISPSHLARAFKQSVGTTLQQYLEDVRLHLARGWLAEGSDSIAEIAKRLGYAHPPAFSAAFRRGVGLSPSVFRRHGGVVPSGLTPP